MTVYLVAGADENYDASAYCFMVGNFAIQSDRRLGWTVVEAYLNGILGVSNFIISKGIYKPVTGFVLCTPSKQVTKIITTNYLEQLYENNWKPLDDGHLFHVPLLKELYYHRFFYKERNINWIPETELGEMEYREFERCMNHLKEILEVPK